MERIQSKKDSFSLDTIKDKVAEVWNDIFKNSNKKESQEEERYVQLQVGKTLCKGVPKQMRSELWLSCLQRQGCMELAELYERFLGIETPAIVISDIEKDILRTFPNLALLNTTAGQDALRHILKAYANWDFEIGYCQGMNFLAGLLLLYMPSEATAFATFVLIMKMRKLREFFSQTMSLLQVQLWQLSRLMSPGLKKHLESCAVVPVLFAAPWLMTCFSTDFPVSFSARVLDVLISNCIEHPILKVAVAILNHTEKKLKSLSSMEDILQFLKRELPVLDEHFLHDILSEAFSKPWTVEELRVLGCSDGAETISESMSRVAFGLAGSQPTESQARVSSTSLPEVNNMPLNSVGRPSAVSGAEMADVPSSVPSGVQFDGSLLLDDGDSLVTDPGGSETQASILGHMIASLMPNRVELDAPLLLDDGEYSMAASSGLKRLVLDNGSMSQPELLVMLDEEESTLALASTPAVTPNLFTQEDNDRDLLSYILFEDDVASPTFADANEQYPHSPSCNVGEPDFRRILSDVDEWRVGFPEYMEASTSAQQHVWGVNGGARNFDEHSSIHSAVATGAASPLSCDQSRINSSVLADSNRMYPVLRSAECSTALQQPAAEILAIQASSHSRADIAAPKSYAQDQIRSFSSNQCIYSGDLIKVDSLPLPDPYANALISMSRSNSAVSIPSASSIPNGTADLIRMNSHHLHDLSASASSSMSRDLYAVSSSTTPSTSSLAPAIPPRPDKTAVIGTAVANTPGNMFGDSSAALLLQPASTSSATTIPHRPENTAAAAHTAAAAAAIAEGATLWAQACNTSTPSSSSSPLFQSNRVSSSNNQAIGTSRPPYRPFMNNPLTTPALCQNKLHEGVRGASELTLGYSLSSSGATVKSAGGAVMANHSLSQVVQGYPGIHTRVTGTSSMQHSQSVETVSNSQSKKPALHSAKDSLGHSRSFSSLDAYQNLLSNTSSSQLSSHSSARPVAMYADPYFSQISTVSSAVAGMTQSPYSITTHTHPQEAAVMAATQAPANHALAATVSKQTQFPFHSSNLIIAGANYAPIPNSPQRSQSTSGSATLTTPSLNLTTLPTSQSPYVSHKAISQPALSTTSTQSTSITLHGRQVHPAASHASAVTANTASALLNPPQPVTVSTGNGPFAGIAAVHYRPVYLPVMAGAARLSAAETALGPTSVLNVDAGQGISAK